MSESNRHFSNRLAIEGGTPVREAPLPWELPGAHWIGEEERQRVDQVINARNRSAFTASTHKAWSTDWNPSGALPSAIAVR